MEEYAKTDQKILTMREVADVLRCSKTHVAHVINGQVSGLPKLTHFCMGRRKLVRREWLEAWMEANKVGC
jgi:excisionase family DNA binding protein